LEAARRAGLDTVPVRICEVASERAAIEISLVENGERSDLDSLTRARSYRALIEQGATVEEIAELVAQGPSHVYQHLQLLDLHADVQQALHTRKLTFADARALAPLQVPDQATVLREIQTAATPLTTRQVKARVDARRVLRLVRQANDQLAPKEGVPENADAPQGNYGALFETQDAANVVGVIELPPNPLDELNALVGEMVVAAQGEDHVRTWARRLSHILQALNREAGNKLNSPSAVQDRLL
jgi:ParB-like chromosome segregation protein Spo0J